MTSPYLRLQRGASVLHLAIALLLPSAWHRDAEEPSKKKPREHSNLKRFCNFISWYNLFHSFSRKKSFHWGNIIDSEKTISDFLPFISLCVYGQGTTHLSNQANLGILFSSVFTISLRLGDHNE